MKHLLNDMSDEEKNYIRGKYIGGKNIDTTKFRKLMESKLGDAKPLLSEQGIESTLQIKIDSFLTQNKLKGTIIKNTNPKGGKELVYMDQNNKPMITFDSVELDDFNRYKNKIAECDTISSEYRKRTANLTTSSEKKPIWDELTKGKSYCSNVLKFKKLIDLQRN